MPWEALFNGEAVPVHTNLVNHVITDVKIVALTEVVSMLDGEQVWWWTVTHTCSWIVSPLTSLSKGVAAVDTTEV